MPLFRTVAISDQGELEIAGSSGGWGRAAPDTVVRIDVYKQPDPKTAKARIYLSRRDAEDLRDALDEALS